MTSPTFLKTNPGTSSSNRRRRAGLVREAYSVWSRRHADCVSALFDEHFVVRHVAPLLRDRAAAPPTPDELARLWSLQVRLGPTASARLKAALVPAAADFLDEVRRAAAA